MVFCESFRFKASYPFNGNKKAPTLMTGIIDGTVFSGHPLRTTLGNGLRVICYIGFALGYMDLTIQNEVSFLVAGDD
jgi:hypothetical protein